MVKISQNSIPIMLSLKLSRHIEHSMNLLFIITHHLVNINSMLKKQLSVCTSSLEINIYRTMCVCVCNRERQIKRRRFPCIGYLHFVPESNHSIILLLYWINILESEQKTAASEINTHACLPTEPENPSVNCHKLSHYSDQHHHLQAWILKPKWNTEN